MEGSVWLVHFLTDIWVPQECLWTTICLSCRYLRFYHLMYIVLLWCTLWYGMCSAVHNYLELSGLGALLFITFCIWAYQRASLNACWVALLFYDHILTLEEEARNIWRKPLSRPSLWFFLNRYPAVTAHIAILIIDFTGLSNLHRVRIIYLYHSEEYLAYMLGYERRTCSST